MSCGIKFLFILAILLSARQAYSTEIIPKNDENYLSAAAAGLANSSAGTYTGLSSVFLNPATGTSINTAVTGVSLSYINNLNRNYRQNKVFYTPSSLEAVINIGSVILTCGKYLPYYYEEGIEGDIYDSDNKAIPYIKYRTTRLYFNSIGIAWDAGGGLSLGLSLNTLEELDHIYNTYNDYIKNRYNKELITISGTGIGWSAGIYYRLSKRSGIGIAYFPQIQVEWEGSALISHENISAIIYGIDAFPPAMVIGYSLKSPNKYTFYASLKQKSLYEFTRREYSKTLNAVAVYDPDLLLSIGFEWMINGSFLMRMGHSRNLYEGNVNISIGAGWKYKNIETSIGYTVDPDKINRDVHSYRLYVDICSQSISIHQK